MTESLSVQRDQQAQEDAFSWALIGEGMLVALLLCPVVWWMTCRSRRP